MESIDVQVLERARELIATPERWLKRELARSAAGKTAFPGDHDAVAFCAEGARMHAWMELGADRNTGIDALGIAASRRGYSDNPYSGCATVRFNNAPETDHPAIQALFGEAIQIAKESADVA